MSTGGVLLLRYAEELKPFADATDRAPVQLPLPLRILSLIGMVERNVVADDVRKQP